MTDWPASHNEVLKKHLDAGLSASQAAAALNAEFRTDRSRNAVIGHAKRTGMAFKRRRSESPLKPAPKPRRAITPAQRPDIAIRRANSGFYPDAFVPRIVDANPQNVTLLELARDGCRWPEGYPALFCNRTQETGRPYCSAHSSIAYRAPEDRPSRAIERATA